MRNTFALLCFVLVSLFSCDLVASGPASSNPSIDGLVLWLDASAPATLELAADKSVKQWRDRSSAQNNAVVGSDKGAPKFVANGFNGNPTVQFSGDSWLDVGKIADGQGDITLFVVFARPDAMESETKWERILSCSEGNREGDNKGNNFELSIPDGKPIKPKIFSELLSSRHRGRLRIGANTYGGSGKLQGLISEIIIYDRGFLVDEQIQQVKDYLHAKWNIAKDPDQDWTRQGMLTDVPQRSSDGLPLSDQVNTGGWSKFEPLWDEFTSDSLNQDKWWDHNPSWFGRQPARFLGEGQNVKVNDGMLHLIMKRDDTLPREKLYSGSDEYHTYSSASVVSKELVRYGYFEIGARAMNSGGSSAFWFSSSVRDLKTGKPYRSEIDVFEIGGKAIGHENAYHMNAHIFATPVDGERHWSKGGTWTAPLRFADDFHVFGLEWTPQKLVYYVDGVAVRRMNNTHWHAPERLIFDSETMGDWLGMPEDKDLPSTFSVQYVRAWKNSITNDDWHDEYEAMQNPDVPSGVTRYVRSMDSHGK